MDFCYCNICGCNGGDCKNIHGAEDCKCNEELIQEVKEITIVSKICESCGYEFHPDSSYTYDAGVDEFGETLMLECTSKKFIGQEIE